MKKFISILLITLLSFSLIACSAGGEGTTSSKEDEKVTEAVKDSVKEEPSEESETPEQESEDKAETESEDVKEETQEAAEEVKSDASGEAKLEGPYIITTCGQSPGAVQIGMAAKMAGTTADDDSSLSADSLDTEKYKTLIVTTGTSMKGMGAAGTDVDKEIKRCVELIQKAQDAGMNVIGAHVEGMARRMDSADQASIDAVMELVDTILIVEASNEDGFFTKYAEENAKELIVVKDAIAIGNVLK